MAKMDLCKLTYVLEYLLPIHTTRTQMKFWAALKLGSTLPPFRDAMANCPKLDNILVSKWAEAAVSVIILHITRANLDSLVITYRTLDFLAYLANMLRVLRAQSCCVYSMPKSASGMNIKLGKLRSNLRSKSIHIWLHSICSKYREVHMITSCLVLQRT